MVRCRERDGHGLEEKVAPPTDVIWWQRCPCTVVPGRRGSIKEGTFVVHNRASGYSEGVVEAEAAIDRSISPLDEETKKRHAS